MNNSIVNLTSFAYGNLLKPLLFRFDPEKVHIGMTGFGERLGKSSVSRNLIGNLFNISDSRLSQKICGIDFPTPIGLAAGFDYEARLTQITSSLGFGFHTIGTITNSAYIGNPKPMLGRLPKSRSLMVNKGFKNFGALETVKKLSGLNFQIPVGISIGRTNSPALNQKDSIKDIVRAFIIFEKSKVKHSYYELNISCPNLYGNVNFYTPLNLQELLREIDKLRIKRPVFIKMPIEKPDKVALALLEVIAAYSPVGVIFGNLQKDRNHPLLDPTEVTKFNKGNFSGKPTFDRSNELIALAYRHYQKRFVIIGCGGIFSAEDAYRKISLGAQLVQLITGMIFQGPQLIAEINQGLSKIVEKEGVNNISDLTGLALR
jgi:dihydroorotate dehydrogenase